MQTFFRYFNLFIDTFNQYGFKADSSAMDGLNKFFKILNNYRREYFMFRTICTMSADNHIF